jgi:hypothetical protein
MIDILPSEILGLAFAYLPLRDLTSSSVVSCAWQEIVFPHLYHTVYLSRPSHIEQIAARVTLDNGSTFSLRTHVRGLVLDELDLDHGHIRHEDVKSVATILAGVSRLEHFFWELIYVTLDPKFIELLHTTCPNLNSIHFVNKNFFKGKSITTSPVIKHLPGC